MTNAVVEISTKQLSAHSLQTQLSPDMPMKEWAKFLLNIKTSGIHQPLTITRGFKVIDGRHRLKAAIELGIENVDVIFADIPENEIADYIADTKLERADLKRGQKAAIVINLYYEEERRKAKESQLSGLKRGEEPPVNPNLDKREIGAVTNEILATKAGVGKSNIAYLVAVKKARSDLFEQVFIGKYSIHKAYTEMKRDEMPPVTEEQRERELVEKQAEVVKSLSVAEIGASQYNSSKPMTDPYNVAVGVRKTALSTSASIINDTQALKVVDDEKVKREAREQILSLVQSGIISLGQTAENDEESEILSVCLELLEKIGGGN